MPGYYTYKQARDAAWNFIIKSGINELPVRLFDVCSRSGIELFSDPDFIYLKGDQHGVTFIHSDKYHIIVNSRDALEEQRFTIAHELGHIFLRHPLTDEGEYGRSYGVRIKPQTQEEYQAERFAMNILAPACVIWQLGLKNADEIAKTCCIPLEYAKARADRMRELKKRSRFGTSESEKSVMAQFQSFVDEYLK